MPSPEDASDVAVRPAVRIEEISAATFDGARVVTNEFLGAGKSVCCVPLWCFPASQGEFNSHFELQYEEALKTTAVAVRESDDRVIGIMKTAIHGQARSAADRGMHETRPGECYIEFLAVASDARGQGVGTRLLKWAEELALSRGCNVLTLGVMNGNPAGRLYQRFGFIRKREGDPCNAMAACLFTSCFIGCPNGVPGGQQMEKPLHY